MLLVSAIFAILLQTIIAEKNTLNRTYEFPETEIETSWFMDDNKNLVYARCNSSLAPGSTKGCIVGLKLDAFEDSVGETKECKVTLKPEMTNAIVQGTVYVDGFGDDKILIIWVEFQNSSDAENQIGWTKKKIAVVHIFDNCQILEAEVNKHKGQPEVDFNCMVNIVIFENTYEVLKDPIGQCKSGSESNGYDIYKFDSQGRKLSGPESWPEPPLKNGTRYITSTKFKQLKEVYFMITKNETDTVVELMDKDSSDYKKREIWKISSNEFDFKKFKASLTNEAISSVYILRNSSIGCWQADEKGDIRMKAQFAFQDPVKAKLITTYNLRKGGLLLAVMKYTNSDEHSHETYDLMRIDEKGQVDSVQIRFDTKCTHSDDIEAKWRMFENNKGQYCIVRLCHSNLQKSSRLETAVLCYSSDEFSRCVDCL